MVRFHRHKNNMHRLFCLFASILIHIRRSPSAVARKHRTGSSALSVNRHQQTKLRLVIPHQKKLSRSREKQTKEGASHKFKSNSETLSSESQCNSGASTATTDGRRGGHWEDASTVGWTGSKSPSDSESVTGHPAGNRNQGATRVSVTL